MNTPYYLTKLGISTVGALALLTFISRTWGG